MQVAFQGVSRVYEIDVFSKMERMALRRPPLIIGTNSTPVRISSQGILETDVWYLTLIETIVKNRHALKMFPQLNGIRMRGAIQQGLEDLYPFYLEMTKLGQEELHRFLM